MVTSKAALLTSFRKNHEFDLSRFELEDIGDHPRKLAQEVHRQLGNWNDGAIPIIDIAYALDIHEIKAGHLTNFEGTILMPPNKAKGSIIVNANSPKKRQYFTIAHELCHLVHGRHKPLSRDKGTEGLFFQCSQQDMRSRGRGTLTPYQRQEVQANQFAAELLMPRYRMRSELRARPNLESVLSLSLSLGVSKETAAQRLVKLHDDAIAIVFFKDGKVRYWAKPDDFPRVKYWKGHTLPSRLLKTNGKTLSAMDEAEPEDWFEEPDGKYLETQVLLQQNGFAMVMLHHETEDEE